MRNQKNRSASNLGRLGALIEAVESRRLFSAALPTISVTAHRSVASEIAPATTGMGQFMVSRGGSTATALTLTYHLWKGGTARSGVDFKPLSGSLKIAKGRSYAYVNIIPITHKSTDPQRSVRLVLDSGKYTVGKQSAQVLIASNAPVVTQPTVSIVATKANASEADPTGTGTGIYTVTRTGSTTHSMDLAYRLDGNARSKARKSSSFLNSLSRPLARLST